VVKRLGFFLMVGVLIGAAFGLFAFAGGENPDYTSAASATTVAPAVDEPATSVGGSGESGGAAPDVQQVAAPVLNAPAPAFMLRNLSGEEISLADYRDQVVLLNFWATWCTTCRAEFPALQADYERLREQGFVVLAVNYDEPASLVQEYVDEMGLTMPVLLDPGARTVGQYRVRGFPTSFVIDENGVIRAIHIGLLTEETIKQYLEEAGF